QLHGPPLRQGRHHGLGPGPRLARQHLPAQAAPVRPLLHHPLDALARSAHPVDDRLPRLGPSECVLSSCLTEAGSSLPLERRAIVRPSYVVPDRVQYLALIAQGETWT